ncbi:MAG: PDZ domain-containing protein [Candidatus Hydrogenedentes bacterium]|nr:PDZ domain-containing protein [Candidatus Hydrogenedentota bacterium]
MMNINRYSTAVLAIFAAALIGVTVSAGALEASLSLRAAVDKSIAIVKPALVRVHVVSTSYRDGREQKYQSTGSGVIITPEGHVITNHHVAAHATRLVCTLSTREEIDAELIGTDPLTDIAVIKLNPADGRIFPTAPFGDSDAAQVGDAVLAMGSPLSLSQSVTLGIVSNTEMVLSRRMGFGSYRQDGEDVGTLVRWIGHDAVIYPGNSGGPLVNMSGEIIGINEISVGLGGAIPGNLAKEVALSIIERGSVPRSWLGITVQPLLKHGDHERGILVSGTIEDSPAAEAGLESGDIMLSLNGVDLTVRFDEQLPAFNRLIAELAIGSKVEAVILREGREQTVTITTAKRQKRTPEQREFKKWGITGRNISFMMSKEMKRDNENGVAVTSVRAGGAAGDAKPAIRRGDLIVAVGGREVKSIDDLIAVTRELTEGAEKPVPTLTTFERREESYVTVVDVGISELNDPGLEVKKAWLPVDTQVITRDIAELLNDASLTGFRITLVYTESTAEEAGLKVGDFIKAVDGEKLTASAPEHYEELPTLIRNYRAGTEVELSVLRDGEELKITVELVRAPKLDREMRKYRDELFEYTARDITFFDKAKENWEQEEQGVLVSEVISGGWAALGMLQVGDLIKEISGGSVGDIDSLRALMDRVAEEQPPSVVVKVLRGIYTVFVELEPKWEST